MTSIQRALPAQLSPQPFLPALLKRRAQRPRLWVVALAIALFAAVSAFRLAVPNPGEAVLIFNAIPIALLSLEVGTRGGLAGAIIGVASIALWSAVDNVELTVIGYLSRVSIFFLVALLAGSLAEHLRQARDAQQQLLDLTAESTLALDLDGHITIGNSAAAHLFGYGTRELTGLPVDDLMPDFFRVLERSVRQQASLGEGVRLTARSKHGSEASVCATVEALASDAGVLLVRLQPAEG